MSRLVRDCRLSWRPIQIIGHATTGESVDVVLRCEGRLRFLERLEQRQSPGGQ
jgi:hypothetical protein